MVSRRSFLFATIPALSAARRCLAETPPEHSAPYVQDVRTDRATICWLSNRREPAQVTCIEGDIVSTPATLCQTRLGGSTKDALYLNEAVFEGLTPQAEYRYSVSTESMTNAAAGYKFRTSSSGPARFVVFGDSGTGEEPQLRLASRMLNENPDFAIHTGDLAYPLGTVPAYRDLYFAPYRDLMTNTPFYPCPGNHDYVGDIPMDYRSLMRVPGDHVPPDDRGLYYSFESGGVHFVSLDTNEPLWRAAAGDDRMLKWLEWDLARATTAWKIAFFHHAPYATGVHQTSAPAKLVREKIVPVLERGGVQVVFCGHEHSYQRSHAIRQGQVDPARGLHYITTGGGGGGLYPAPPGPLQAFGLSAYHFVAAEVDGHRLHLRAVGLEGEQLDAVTVTAG